MFARGIQESKSLDLTVKSKDLDSAKHISKDLDSKEV